MEGHNGQTCIVHTIIWLYKQCKWRIDNVNQLSSSNLHRSLLVRWVSQILQFKDKKQSLDGAICNKE